MRTLVHSDDGGSGMRMRDSRIEVAVRPAHRKPLLDQPARELSMRERSRGVVSDLGERVLRQLGSADPGGDPPAESTTEIQENVPIRGGQHRNSSRTYDPVSQSAVGTGRGQEM